MDDLLSGMSSNRNAFMSHVQHKWTMLKYGRKWILYILYVSILKTGWHWVRLLLISSEWAGQMEYLALRFRCQNREKQYSPTIICQYLFNKRWVIEISIFTCTIAVRCNLFCEKCFQFVTLIFLLTCRHVKQIKRADTEGFCSFSCSVWHWHLWNWRNRDYRWDTRRSSDCGNKSCATLMPADCLHGRAGENPGRNSDHQS